MFLECVVRALNEHVLEARPLEDVGHRGAHTEGVNGPATAALGSKHTFCDSRYNKFNWLKTSRSGLNQ